MITQEDKRKLAGRLSLARNRLLNEYPFYGRLLMRLTFALAECGTAYTDMQQIVFDPAFAGRISDEELIFVLMHEVLHCALNHCTRGRTFVPWRYNIACDTVVNSLILESMGRSSFEVDNEEVMHLAPNGREGALYDAESVYHMLTEQMRQRPDPGNGLSGDGPRAEGGARCDTHDPWKEIQNGTSLQDQWNYDTSKAAESQGDGDAPSGVYRHLRELGDKGRLPWREILKEFVTDTFTDWYYTFSPGAKRYSYLDFVLPDVTEMPEEEVRDLWFFVDASGSMSNRDIQNILTELKSLLLQMERVRGLLFFFDNRVREPVEFGDIEELAKVRPPAMGGTSFQVIFEEIRRRTDQPRKEAFEEPKAVIIMTDGLAPYPSEEKAGEIPVLWILTGRKGKEPPWGKVLYLESGGEHEFKQKNRAGHVFSSGNMPG